ncbi:hypothetical protein [Xanthomonas sp. XNM01]|uniref:hypothetical protein n=1 Tax=Xanthomonas sp. XNM01 TaxID=2769289 RepID=UPI00177E5C29|nr:hypothetical protein [Xanthomonas sp. XNM01]MBD9369243.1 hypothetical protein [Xanthomonas sp. XNM01]
MPDTQDDMEQLHEHAYASMDRGDLAGAARDFGTLLLHQPENRSYHYMAGLAHKYRLDWPASLEHNLRAIALDGAFDEAHHWNAAIAATALGRWSKVRELWAACGIAIPPGDGPIASDFGIAVVRLAPWGHGETVFARRIDPVRARLLNVPLPESGHRFGDIVLHDGASTGSRFDGDHEVHVFNGLERLVPSPFQTFVVFVHAGSKSDIDALLRAEGDGIGYSEDWTHSIRSYCLRCSYGAPHRHADDDGNDWQSQRNLGIAALDRHAVDTLLGNWAADHPGRHVEAVEVRECPVPAREDGRAWWLSPDLEDELVSD